MVKADCTTTLDSAQACVKQCGIDETADETMSLLTYCVGTDFTGNLTTLTTCCEMDDNCKDTMKSATVCLDEQYVGVRVAAQDYFSCILTEGNCFWPELCVGMVAGGYGNNNFTDLSLLYRQADSCADENLSTFGRDACDILGTCCETCKPELATLINTVSDDILLTTYGSPGIESCAADKTCDDYLGTTERKLYGTGGDLVGPAEIVADYESVAKELAEECNSGLTQDIILYNESHAVTTYFDCLYKKTGKAAAVLDDAEQKEASSGISLSFGPTAALSAMASVVYAIVA